MVNNTPPLSSPRSAVARMERSAIREATLSPHFADAPCGLRHREALRPGAARPARWRSGAEDRRVDRAGGALDVLGQERAGALGVARQRRLDDRDMLAAQAAPRDRAPQHGA